MEELILIKGANNGVTKFESRISELYISEQIFCRMMTFQNAYHWLLFKLCIKLNNVLNRSKQI